MKLTSLTIVTFAEWRGRIRSSLRAVYRPPYPPPRMRTFQAMPRGYSSEYLPTVSDDAAALAFDMERKAEAIVAAAAANRDELDFSLESLVALDAMLDRLFGRRWPVGRNGRLDAGRFGAMIEPIGAYV